MRYAPLALALLLLVGLGVNDLVNAARISRIRDSGVIQAKLDTIPKSTGDWTSVEQPFDDKMLQATKAIAHISRRYTRNGPQPAVVDVLVLAGEPSELGAHDPERCYGGTGYRSLGSRTRKTVPDEAVNHSFWAERFLRETLPAASMEVTWAWCSDGRWQASESPRTSFAAEPVICKIYLSRRLAVNDTEGSDPTTELLRELAPLARVALSGPRS